MLLRCTQCGRIHEADRYSAFVGPDGDVYVACPNECYVGSIPIRQVRGRTVVEVRPADEAASS